MSRHILVALAFLLLLATSANALQAIPEFALNMDLPPNQRWNGAVKKIVDLYGWDYSFGPVIDLYEPLFILFPPNLTSSIDSHLAQYYPALRGELQGIGAQLSAIGKCSLCNTTMMMAFAYFYELSHIGEFRKAVPRSLFRSCTGILSLPTNKSAAMIHGRNMDENPHQGRNITLKIQVFKGGKFQYTMVDWTWLTGGIATASRIGGVTLEMNWNTDGPTLSLQEILKRILEPSTVPVLQSFRIIQDSAMNFDKTVQFITSSTFASPYYNIISGTGRRGAVLTIEWNKASNVVQYLNDTSSTTFMVQTNYDRWVPDPPSDPRRTVAENALKMIGRERSGTELGVWMALSTYPVHNEDTLFTALMSVEKQPECYVRVAMTPKQYL